MLNLRSLESKDVLASAAKALSREDRASWSLLDPETLSDAERRNLLVRARATDGGGRARSVIIKATRSAEYDPTSDAAFEKFGVVREWVAAAYLARHAPARAHGATLLAGDVAQGILVYEDLGSDLASLVDPLLEGGASDAEVALTSYAVALGRLHADTAGSAEAHAETLRSIFGSRSRVRASRTDFAGLAASTCGSIGGIVPDQELAQVSDRINLPGAWQALVHGDPCPDIASS